MSPSASQWFSLLERARQRFSDDPEPRLLTLSRCHWAGTKSIAGPASGVCDFRFAEYAFELIRDQLGVRYTDFEEVRASLRRVLPPFFGSPSCRNPAAHQAHDPFTLITVRRGLDPLS